MVSTLRGKFETAARLNGASVTYCGSTSDVARYIFQIANRRGLQRVLWAPPAFRDNQAVMDILLSNGIHCISDSMRKNVMDTPIGVTGADGAIAETGCLLLNSFQESTRLVTSLTETHIAVLTVSTILATLEDATSLWDIGPVRRTKASHWTMIGGPSKTIAIEQFPVPGMHGPRELHILLI